MYKYVKAIISPLNHSYQYRFGEINYLINSFLLVKGLSVGSIIRVDLNNKHKHIIVTFGHL